MNNKEVLVTIGKEIDFKQEDVKRVLVAYANLVKENYDEKIPLMDVGSFQAKIREARMAHNPQTGDKIEVPKKQVLYFHINPATKREVTKEI